MNNNPNPVPQPARIDKKWLFAAILCVGTLLYVIAIGWIGFGSIQHVNEINARAQEETALKPGEETQAPEPYPISDFITQALLVIGSALATHLGAYLGITITDPSRRLVEALGAGSEWLKYMKSPDGVSGILAVAYFLALVAAIIFWAVTGFSAYAGKPLQDLAYSFLGIFAGAMAALSQSA